jgi:hypothetical protein
MFHSASKSAVSLGNCVDLKSQELDKEIADRDDQTIWQVSPSTLLLLSVIELSIAAQGDSGSAPSALPPILGSCQWGQFQKVSMTDGGFHENKELS